MHLPPQINDLAMILGVAAVVTFLFQKIRQPLVLGYIVAGVIVGPYTPTGLTVADLENVKVWAELGVIFLMFSLGLEFTFHKLVRVGVTAAGTSIVELVLMMLFGYGTGHVLGWSPVDSLFLGGILSISSTTIIIKAFEEMGVKTRRYAEIVFGILVVEDLVAILLLVALSTVAVTQTFLSMELLYSALKLVLIVGSWCLLGYFLIPSFLRYAGKLLANENLTVLSTGLCLVLVVVATHFHYSAALGAFIMGSILAETSEIGRIETLIHPLKDLFAAVFFVSVGMLVDPTALMNNLGPIVLITLVTIFGKIFSTTAGALLTGQPLRRSVQIGFSLAQIGEFSFIIATLGSSLKVTSDFLYPIAVTVSVITTFTTPYLVKFSDPFAAFLERVLPPRLIASIAGYSAWTQTPRQHHAVRQLFAKHALRFSLNALMVTLVFLGMWELGVPKLQSIFPGTRGLIILSWAGAILLSSPFVWGMFFAFRTPDTKTGFYLFLSQLVTIAWMGGLTSLFFPTSSALLLTLAGTGALFFFLYRRLERSYHWFERRFLNNIAKKEQTEKEIALEALAPWDVHTVSLTLHQNSILAGRSIKEEQIRKRFGLNIVAIERGAKIIPSPTADELLLPNDELLVLGTDQQIDSFRKQVESPAVGSGDGKTLSDYHLRQVLIEEGSELIGQSIRGSGLRQSLKGLVAGLERGTMRTINPDPATELKSGDILWVVSS